MSDSRPIKRARQIVLTKVVNMNVGVLKPHIFPNYDHDELRADCVVHIAGILGSLIGLAWLTSRLPADASDKLALSIGIYGLGLLSMLTASAAYNLVPAGIVKAGLRRLDRAMIFMMIAGSYTPFALIAFPEFSGRLLFSLIWFMAIAGVILTLTTSWSNRLLVGLYIAMGWVILGFLPILIISVNFCTLALLVLGGIVYSIGALIHSRDGMRFHNAIWHAMVLAGATLHFGAIYQLL